MTNLTFFFILIPSLAAILLSVTLILAPHEPYKEKETPFECGYHSFIQTRVEVNVIHFGIGLLFLIFDLEVVMLFPFSQSAEFNGIYGLITAVLFIGVLTLGFIFEIGKKALKFLTKVIINNVNDSKLSTYNKPLESKVLPITTSFKSYLITFVTLGLFFYIFNIVLGLNLGFLIGILSIIVARVVAYFLDSKNINWNVIYITLALFTFMYIIKLTFFYVGTYLYHDIFHDNISQSDKYTIPTFTTISYFFSDLLAEKYLYMGSDNALSNSISHKSKHPSHISYAMSDEGNNSNSDNKTQSERDNTKDVSNKEMDGKVIANAAKKAAIMPHCGDTLFIRVHEAIDISEQDTTDESSLGVNYTRENLEMSGNNILKALADKDISGIGDAVENAKEFSVESKSLIESLEQKESDMSPSDKKDKLSNKITECEKKLKSLERAIDYAEEEYKNAVNKTGKND